MIWKKFNLFRQMGMILWASIFLCMAIPMPVSAKSQDGIEVNLSTDKSSYQDGDRITVTTSVVNTNNGISAKNVKIVNQNPEGFQLVEGSSAENVIENLGPQESTSLTSIYEKISDSTKVNTTNTGTTNKETETVGTTNDTPNTGDNTHIIFWFILFIFSIIGIIFVIRYRISKKSSLHNIWILGIVILGVCISIISFSVKAAESKAGSIDIIETVKFENEPVELKATVSYSIDVYTPSTDADVYINENLYSDYAGDEHIKHDKDTGITYFDNELLIFFKGDIEDAIARLNEDISMTIVGKNIYDNSCLIRFDHAEKYQNLLQICDKLKEKDYVKSAYLNYSYEKNPQYYPNDSEWRNLWEERPGGDNWGIEAISAPQVWEFVNEMRSINIGVYDAGFDVSHKDLRDVATTWVSGNEELEDINHGTHVAGIIGAEFDNEYGIAGVFPKAKLETISCRIDVSTDNVSSNIDKLAYSYLIAEKNCKVINESLGNNVLCFAASQGEVSAQEQLKKSAAVLDESLSALNRDFIICTSAGNTSGNGYQFVKSDDAYYGYYQIEINDDKQRGYFDNENNWHQYLGKSISAPCDATWANNITCISSENLKNRIVVVGAAQLNKDSSYSLADFSNKGERVDVVAPGVGIESTISSQPFFEVKQGTSMASPHVAGLAGILYSINPYVTGEQVKSIIVETATTAVSGSEDKKMINAIDAYERLKGLYSTIGKISGKVVDEQGNPISGATVMMTDSSINGIPFGATTNENGEFIIDSETGRHSFEIKKDGFNSYEGTAMVEANTTTIIPKNIVLEKSGDNTITGTVYSDIDKLPLANVEVKGYKSDSEEPINLGTSNTDGEYSITLDSDIIKVEFSLSGFKTKEIFDFLLFDGNVYLEKEENIPEEISKIDSVYLPNRESAIITEGGELFMSGLNNYGQLGNGTTIDSHTYVKVMNDVKSFASDGQTSAAIKSDNSLWMWGNNSGGQFGNGTTDSSYTPIMVMEGVEDIVMSNGTIAIIKTDHSLWMWGRNSSGMFGDGTVVSSNVPIKVMDNIKQIIMPNFYVAALSDDNRLFTWGRNGDGRLGNGVLLNDNGNIDTSIYEPQLILENVKYIAGNGSNMSAITMDNTLWRWGSNSGGQLGDGDSESLRKSKAEPVRILENVKSIPEDGTAAAITFGGTLWVWGHWYDGITNRWEMLPTEKMSNVRYVSEFDSDEGWRVITEDNSLWVCDVGNQQPVKVTDSVEEYCRNNVNEVIIKSDGSAWGKGDNSYGQLGFITDEISIKDFVEINIKDD